MQRLRSTIIGGCAHDAQLHAVIRLGEVHWRERPLYEVLQSLDPRRFESPRVSWRPVGLSQATTMEV